MKEKIAFRKLTEDDLPLMHTWLNKKLVIDNYSKGPLDVESIKKKYISRIDGKDPTPPYLMLYEGKPIGFIQAYKLSDYPEFTSHLKDLIKLDDTAAIDLFIGEEEFLGKGLGPLFIKKFSEEIIFKEMGCSKSLGCPSTENKPSIRAFEKAGFKYLKTIYNPKDKFYEYVLCLTSQ